MGVLHGNRDRVEPPGPNLVKSRDPLADPIAMCGGGPVIRQILTVFYGTQAEIRPKTAYHFK